MHNNLLGIQNINEKHQGKRPFGELGMERWKILKWILEKVYEGGNWIKLDQDRILWRASGSFKAGDLLTKRLSASQ
jgi:hypothetical protein